MMADNQLFHDNNGGDGVGGDEDIFVYTGGEQRVPRDVKRVRIAENVDTIPANTFEGCEHLIEVEGHNRLKKVEEYVFHSCYRLRRVTKMAGVIEIGNGAFEYCHPLSEIDFDKLEIIGNHALYYCEKSLESVNMPSVRIIGDGAFERCKKLTGAVFGQYLERIEGFAFHDCTALRSIVIPLKDNLIIHDHAFTNCGNLSRVDTLVGGIHNTISSLHLESWRNEMQEELDRINQTLPNFRIGKTQAIQQWITRVLSRTDHY
jgi:hypothetical protein